MEQELELFAFIAIAEFILLAIFIILSEVRIHQLRIRLDKANMTIQTLSQFIPSQQPGEQVRYRQLHQYRKLIFKVEQCKDGFYFKILSNDMKTVIRDWSKEAFKTPKAANEAAYKYIDNYISNMENQPPNE